LIYKWVRSSALAKDSNQQNSLFGNFCHKAGKESTAQQAKKKSDGKSSSRDVNTADSEASVNSKKNESVKKGKKVLAKNMKKGPKTTKVRKTKVNRVRALKGAKKTSI
jgi:RNA-splicing ligase RtcB